MSCILHCIPTLGGGGAERQLSLLATELQRRGVQNHIAFLRGGSYSQILESTGVQLHLLPGESVYSKKALVHLYRLVGALQPRVVQTWLPYMDIVAGAFALARGIGWVLSERSSEHAYQKGWRTFLRTHLGMRAQVVANSREGSEYWMRLGHSRVSVISNALQLEEIAAAPKYELPDGAEQSEAVVFIGRYSYEKNVFTMLEAMDRVIQQRPQVRFFMYGEGDLRASIFDLKGRLRTADRIHVMPYTDAPWSVIKASRLFISVSDFEGMPNTVLEAAACGCPMVLSDIPAHREAVGESAAYFVDGRSPDRIASGVLASLSNPGIAQERARSAKDVVSALTIQKIAEMYLTIYKVYETR